MTAGHFCHFMSFRYLHAVYGRDTLVYPVRLSSLQFFHYDLLPAGVRAVSASSTDEHVLLCDIGSGFYDFRVNVTAAAAAAAAAPAIIGASS